MFDHLLESSRRDDSNKWSNIGFGQEIIQVETVEVHFMHLIWSSVTYTSRMTVMPVMNTLINTSSHIMLLQAIFTVFVKQFLSSV